MRNNVDEMLGDPFGGLTFVWKLEVIRGGRPKPILKREIQVSVPTIENQ